MPLHPLTSNTLCIDGVAGVNTQIATLYGQIAAAASCCVPVEVDRFATDLSTFYTTDWSARDSKNTAERTTRHAISLSKSHPLELPSYGRYQLGFNPVVMEEIHHTLARKKIMCVSVEQGAQFRRMRNNVPRPLKSTSLPGKFWCAQASQQQLFFLQPEGRQDRPVDTQRVMVEFDKIDNSPHPCTHIRGHSHLVRHFMNAHSHFSSVIYSVLRI